MAHYEGAAWDQSMQLSVSSRSGGVRPPAQGGLVYFSGTPATAEGGPKQNDPTRQAGLEPDSEYEVEEGSDRPFTNLLPRFMGRCPCATPRVFHEAFVLQ